MKRIELTERIKSFITASVGDTIDYEKIAAFEATAVTSLPLNKRGSVFDRGQITAETFIEAANLINTGTFVPLHTLHEQGYEIPVGRLFYGEHVKSNQGTDELRVLFFLDGTSPDLISRLDTGVIEEVSVGMQFKRLLCSTCNIDLMEDNESIWSQTCKNGHVMGMGTNHVKPDGVANFREMSLVSKGASNGAKVLGAQKRLLASAYYKDGSALAASLKDPEFMLFGSPTKLAEEDPMLIAELQAKLAKAEGDLTLTATAKTEAEGKVATLEAAKTEAEGKVAVLEAKLAAEAENNSGLAASITTWEAACTASEAAKTEAEGKVATLEAAKAEVETKLLAAETELAPLKAAQTATLTQRPFKLPMGGVANLNTTTTDSEKPKTVTTGSNAFRTPK
jgi:hypothetical protein